MDKKGQTTVEFALAALLVLTLLFTIIDLGVMFYVNLTMQHAVREGARYAIIGQPSTSTGATADQARLDALTTQIKNSSNGLYIDANIVSGPTVSVLTPSNTVTFSNYTVSPASGTGQPDQIIIVRLTYAWPLWFELKGAIF